MVVHQSKRTSVPGVEAGKVTVRCSCGENTFMFTLEGNMTSKGLKLEGVVLRVASPKSLQRNLSRSRAPQTLGPIAFTLFNFLLTNNAEIEIVAFLQQRPFDV